jgi:hypothetical protein
MKPTDEPVPPANEKSFAGLLASLTAPKPEVPSGGSSPSGRKASPAWNDDGLADDVATLSYESALRAHARYRTPDPTDRALTQGAEGDERQFDHYELATEGQAAEPQSARMPSPGARGPSGAKTRLNSEASSEREKVRPVAGQGSSAAGAISPVSPTPYRRSLKTVSVTIRVSQAEADQLHGRAAEAGLTVSAYLRSCTFEVERLRALVKETMAQLRPAAPARKRAPRAHRTWGTWLGRLFTPWRGSGRVARV